MNSRQRIRNIIAGKPADRCGFWLGNPHPDSWQALHQYLGTSSEGGVFADPVSGTKDTPGENNVTP